MLREIIVPVYILGVVLFGVLFALWMPDPVEHFPFLKKKPKPRKAFALWLGFTIIWPSLIIGFFMVFIFRIIVLLIENDWNA